MGDCKGSLQTRMEGQEQRIQCDCLCRSYIVHVDGFAQFCLLSLGTTSDGIFRVSTAELGRDDTRVRLVGEQKIMHYLYRFRTNMETIIANQRIHDARLDIGVYCMGYQQTNRFGNL